MISPSLDRYLLPLLPVVICLILWALQDVRLITPAAWVATAAFAVFAVAGTRDYLALQQATWDLARQANGMGVSNTRLDAGATWDGIHLLEYSIRSDIPIQTPAYEYATDDPNSLKIATPPWWILAWAPATNSSYIIAGEPLIGFGIVTRREYSSWLHSRPTYLYLLRRPGISGPP